MEISNSMDIKFGLHQKKKKPFSQGHLTKNTLDWFSILKMLSRKIFVITPDNAKYPNKNEWFRNWIALAIMVKKRNLDCC